MPRPFCLLKKWPMCMPRGKGACGWVLSGRLPYLHREVWAVPEVLDRGLCALPNIPNLVSPMCLGK
jgi:hypothetical protein